MLMVRPARFAFNEQTAANNAFQQKSDDAEATAEEALREFDAFVDLLRQNGVTVDVLQDTPEPPTPDSIFPNNCFSTHGDTLVLYPMYAQNRRLEREKLKKVLRHLHYSRDVDFTPYEISGHFLEGTGSLVLDREHSMAYACLSPRTDEEALKEWAKTMAFRYFAFHSFDEKGTPVYHTNVMMHVGTRQAVVCLDSVRDESERSKLLAHLHADGKEVVPITIEQMHQFAGNMLELHNDRGEQLLVMSQTARQSLTPEQLATLSKYTRILSPDIHAIETAGGGSARCMLAELSPLSPLS